MMNWTGRKTYSALEDGDCEASREKQPAPAPAPILLRSTGLWLFATCVAIILSFSLGRIFPKAERSAVAPNNIVPTCKSEQDTSNQTETQIKCIASVQRLTSRTSPHLTPSIRPQPYVFRKHSDHRTGLVRYVPQRNGLLQTSDACPQKDYPIRISLPTLPGKFELL